MLRPKMKWLLQENNMSGYDKLQKALGVSSLTAKFLWSRGFRHEDEAKEWMYPTDEQYHDPFLLDDMEKTVARIQQAIESNEKILIFGDYDADGVTSTSMLMMALLELEAQVDWYIPNRFTEGYGPNIPAFERAKENDVSLIITVDNGIAAVAEIEAANDLGMDVIVTDHHEPPPELPNAYAIINPKKETCAYPYKELCGAGVVFKLVHALRGTFPHDLLDLVTIATISDLVSLTGENRALVQQGLKALSNSKRPGIKALMDIAHVSGKVVNEEHIGFVLGPRLNAAGRIDSANPAVHLLLSETMEEALTWAQELEKINTVRKNLVDDIAKEAVREVEETFLENDKVIVIGKANWHSGVIGIVASRLLERFYRPVIVFSIDEEAGVAKGSARSIEGFDMFQELSKNRDLFTHFGGHAMACGLTMKTEDIETLRIRLCEQAEVSMKEEDFIPKLPMDVSLSVEDVTVEALTELMQLGPFGIGNPKPMFLFEDVTIVSKRKIGSDNNHMKMELSSNGAMLESIGFQFGHLVDQLTEGVTASVAGELSVNEWNGFRKPQLQLKDMTVTEWQLFDYRRIRHLRDIFSHLPDEEETSVICFQEKTYEQLQSFRFDNLYMHDELKKEMNGRMIAIADMPHAVKELTDALTAFSHIERIYMFLYDTEETFFQPLPTREQFKWYFAFLKNQNPFHYEKYKEVLARKKGWTVEHLSWMTKVFLELHFVTMENGVVSLNPAPEKKSLMESFHYRKRLEKQEAEQKLLYSTYAELKKTIAPYIQVGTEIGTKEKVGNGL